MNSSTRPGQEASGGGANASMLQLLTFHLGSESYGVDIRRVQEIRGFGPVTPLPQLPPDVLGVLNLRGAIVPIIDLRARFSIERVAPTSVTVIIVLSVRTAAGSREFGLVVDGVSDVTDIRDGEMKAAPDLAASVGLDCIVGLVQSGDRMVIVLDVDRLLVDMISAPAESTLPIAAIA